MNCPRINRSGKPADWFHSLFCAECRAARRADDLLAFGIVQLRRQAPATSGLNNTLTALDLAPVAENYYPKRRQRQQRQFQTALRASIATAVLSTTLGWYTYINWMPAEPNAQATIPDTRGFDALQAAYKAMPPLPKRMADTISTIEKNGAYAPLQEAAAVDLFLHDNAETLNRLHTALTLPYHEEIAHSLEEDFKRFDSRGTMVTNLSTVLRADAVWKFTHKNHAGAVRAALDLLDFGAQIEGGGSEMARLLGGRSQSYGRVLLWRLLPELSAQESADAARELERLHTLYLPLLETLQWERASGMTVRREIMSRPLWRWRTADLWGQNNPRWAVTLLLHTVSDRQILRNYANLMDRAVFEQTGPYHVNIPSIPEARFDLLNSALYSEYSSAQFTDCRNQAMNALLMTALALRSYQQQTGDYPPNLQALTPRYLREVPRDPFQPADHLNYRQMRPITHNFDDAVRIRKASHVPTYLLYSVGPDCIDQLGSPVLAGNPKYKDADIGVLNVTKESIGDIVAGISR